MFKRKMLVVVFLSMVFSIIIPLSVVADDAGRTQVYKKGSDIEIQFEKKKESDVIPPKPKPPVIDPGGDKGPIRVLPSTGEVLTSLIIILIGLSIFLFLLGVIVLKQVNRELSWEY